MDIRLRLCLVKILKRITKGSPYLRVFLWLYLVLIFFFLSWSSLSAQGGLAQADEVKSQVGMKWKTQVKGRTQSPLVVRNVSVYIGTEGGILYVLRSRSGALKWQYDTGERVRCTPNVYAGRIFLATDRGGLHVLDAFSGTRRWIFNPSGVRSSTFRADYGYISFPRWAGNRVYYSSTDGKIHCLDASSGDSYWSYSSRSGFCSSPFLYKGKVYFSSGEGNVYALDSASGNPIWTKELGKNADTSPIIYKDLILQATTDNAIYALRISDGALRWRKGIPEKASSLRVSSGLLYVSSVNGNLYALSLSRRHIKWRFDTEGSSLSPPTVSGNTVYLGSNDGRFYALDVRDGTGRWTYETGGFFAVSPVVVNKGVYGAASKETKKGASIEVIAFEKGSYPGKVILIGTRTESVWFERLFDYFSTLSENTFSSYGTEANMPRIIQLSNWPVDILVQSIKRPESEMATGWLADVFDWLPNVAAVGFWYAVLLSPWILVVLVQLVAVGLAILVGLLEGTGLTRRGWVGASFVSSNRQPLASQLRGIGDVTSCLGQAFKMSFANYWLFVINMAALGVVLGVVYLFAFFVTSELEVGRLLAVVLILWILALAVGTVSRGISLSLVRVGDTGRQSRLTGALKHFRKSYRSLLGISLVYGFIFFSVFLSIGLAKAVSPFIVGTLVVLATLASGLVLFSDASSVLDGGNFGQAFRTSIRLVVDNFLPVLIYLLTAQVILVATVVVSLFLLTSFWGLMIFLIFCSVSAVVLSFWHGLVYETFKART